MRDIPGEADRQNDPGDGRDRAAPGDPPPLRRLAAGADAVECGQEHGEQHEHRRPTAEAHKEIRRALEADEVEQDGQHDDGGHQQDQEHQRASGEAKRHGGQQEEIALLFFLVDAVQRAEDGLAALVGAPHRRADPQYHAEAEAARRILREPLDLLPNDIEPATRQESGDRIEVLGDRAGVGDQTIERDKRGNGRKDGKKREKGDARRLRQQFVLAKFLNCPFEDVPPAARRDLRRSRRALAGYAAGRVLRVPHAGRGAQIRATSGRRGLSG